MEPATRQQHIDYCLRNLGAPVIEINVDEDQLEDRVDEAIQQYREHHHDAAERFYLTHTIVQDDIDNGYISVPDYVTGVKRVLSINDTVNSSETLFNLNYQIRLHNLFDLANTSVVHYDMTLSHLRLLDIMFGGDPGIEFNRLSGRIFINADLNNFEPDDSILVFEAYRALDPDEFTKIWNDIWLKKYTTALFKRQWGANLSKYEQIQLPGGVVLNGQQLYDTAIQEIEKLQEDLRLTYETPLDFYFA